MAYDPVRQRVVMFGGGLQSTFLDETWEWDGNDWTRRTPTASPSPRRLHSMVYDTDRQRIVLFGGQDGAFLGDQWQWDGNDWTQMAPAVLPPGRDHHAMAYAAARQHVVLYGGINRTHPPLEDTWSIGPLVRQTAATQRSACAGSNGLPVLTGHEPYLGNPAFRLQLLEARPTSVCLFALALVPADLDLGNGCRWYLADPFVLSVGVTDAHGFAESPALAIPLDMTLRGGPVFAQAVIADPQGPVFGLAFSAGRKLVLGD
jgi:hypothetical protein